MSEKYNIRAIAVKILHNKKTRFLQDVLQEEIDAASIESKDKDLLFQIVLGVARNDLLLGKIIEALLVKKKAKKFLMLFLKVAIFQAVFLDKIPQYAIVSDMMKSADIFKLNIYQKKFLRGVIGKFFRSVDDFNLKESQFANSLSLFQRYSYPEWLVKKWQNIFDDDTLVSILEAGNTPPFIWIVPVNHLIDFNDIKKKLLDNKIKFQSNVDLNYFSLTKMYPLIQSFLDDGKVIAQSPHQLRAIQSCKASSGDAVLEIGAAPGGKTVSLSSMVGEKGKVVAVDKSKSRISLLKTRVSKSKLANVNVICADITLDELAGVPEKYDHVVLDVPCSNLAELSRRPEARWRIDSNSIRKYCIMQKKMIKHSFSRLKQNGTFLYMTCTLVPEENENMKKYILDNFSCTVLEEKLSLPTILIPAGGYFVLFKKTAK